MRKCWSENSISDGLTEAYHEISVLAEEMREAFESTPEQFKENSGKEREIAADILESVFDPTVPACISGEQHWIRWLEMRAGKDGKLFRPARRDNVVRCLEAGLAYAARVEDDSSEMVQFIKDIKIDINNLQCIHFPGMSGR